GKFHHPGYRSSAGVRVSDCRRSLPGRARRSRRTAGGRASRSAGEVCLHLQIQRYQRGASKIETINFTAVTRRNKGKNEQNVFTSVRAAPSASTYSSP